MRMALGPRRGDTSIPIRSAYFGAIFGVLAIVAVLVFASSVKHLGTTPLLLRLHLGPLRRRELRHGNAVPAGSTRASGVTDLAGVCVQDIQLDGHPVNALAFHRVRGAIRPSIVKGRAPANAHEVALGAKTLRALSKKIADTVHSSSRAQDDQLPRTVSFRIVGQAALPALGANQPPRRRRGAHERPVRSPRRHHRHAVRRRTLRARNRPEQRAARGREAPERPSTDLPARHAARTRPAIALRTE
jgi:hypothetical protein